MQIGTVISLPVSGLLISVGFLGGWPSVFYVFGVLGIIWGIPWFLLTHDRPEKHPRISQVELNFIQRHREVIKKEEVFGVLRIFIHAQSSTDLRACTDERSVYIYIEDLAIIIITILLPVFPVV